MKSLLVRTLTGIVYIAATAFLLLFDEYTFLIYLLLCNAVISYEFLKMAAAEHGKPYYGYVIGGSSATIAMCFAFTQFHIPSLCFWLLPIPILTMFVHELLSKHDKHFILPAISLMCLLYVCLPFVAAHFIVCGQLFDYQAVSNTFVPQILLGILILIWLNDTMAYCVGCLLGRHRLYERISPKKTWEGAIGGALFCLVGGGFIGRLSLFGMLTTTEWLWIAAIVVVFGSLGDLIESMFKRSSGIKDSGNILPGHGGLFDRLDSFIFTLPWVFIFFTIKKLLT